MNAPSQRGRSYIESVLRVSGKPELDPERTKALVARYQQTNQAKDKRYIAHLIYAQNVRYGLKIVSTSLRSFPPEEIPGILYESLWHALERYTPEHNTTFCTYWTHWIRKCLFDAARTTDNAPYRLSKYFRSMLAQYAKATTQLHLEHGSFSDEMVAHSMGVSIDTVRILRDFYLSKHTSLSLNQPVYEDGEPLEANIADSIQRPTSERYDLERIEQQLKKDFQNLLVHFQEVLDLNMLTAIILCHLYGFSQSDTGMYMGHTRERIRQMTSESSYSLRFTKHFGVSPPLLGRLGRTLIAIAILRDRTNSLHPILRFAIPYLDESWLDVEKTTIFAGGYQALQQDIARALQAKTYFNATQWERDVSHAHSEAQKLQSQKAKSYLFLETLQRAYKSGDKQQRRVFLQGRQVLASCFHPSSVIDDELMRREQRGKLIRLNSPHQGELLCFLPAPS